MLKRIAVLCCAVLLGARPLSGQEPTVPEKLTLTEALRLGEARSPRLVAAQAGADIAGADRTDAARRPNPAVSVEGENYPLFEPSRPAFVNNQELTVRFDREVETAGRRGLRLEAADTALDAARARVDEARRLLQLDVGRAYFRVVLAQADQQVAQAALGELERVIGLTRARYDRGETSGAEFRRLQVERLRFVEDVFAAELAARNARAELLGLLNVTDLRQVFRAVDPLEPSALSAGGDVIATAAGGVLDVQALRGQALARRPDLRAVQLDRTRAETETRLQRALRTPNVTVGGGYRRDFGRNAVVFGVTIPVPLFNSLNPGGVQRADAERRRAEAVADVTVRQVEVELQQAINAVEISAERARYVEREYLVTARESRDIVQASYELGAADLIDFLDAQRAFRETQRVRNQTLYDLRVSLVELAVALGLSPAGQF
jgi:cobalt-zinc-cadmium efflux system outer membrane protein